MPPEAIEDSDELYRRLAPGWVKPDGTVASVAYKRGGRPENEISVDLARFTTPAATLSGRPHFGLGVFVAAMPRALGFDVIHDPELNNYAHSVIRGDNSKQKCRLLAEKTSVLLPPRPV